MVCQFLLCNKVNQLYVNIYPHISSLLCLPPTLPIPPIQVVTEHPADLPVLCGCFPLAIYFTFYLSILHLVVYISTCQTLTSSPLTLPPSMSSSPFSTSASLFLSCPQVLHNLFFFLESIYMCQHTVFVFLFLTYFTLYDSLQVHPPHYT